MASDTEGRDRTESLPGHIEGFRLCCKGRRKAAEGLKQVSDMLCKALSDYLQIRGVKSVRVSAVRRLLRASWG